MRVAGVLLVQSGEGVKVIGLKKSFQFYLKTNTSSVCLWRGTVNVRKAPSRPVL